MRYYEIVEGRDASGATKTNRTANARRSFTLAQDRKSDAARNFTDKMCSIDSSDENASHKRAAAARKRDTATKAANAAMASARERMRVKD